MCSCFNGGLLDVAAHGVEELLGLECWSLTALVQEEVALLEKIHHWILEGHCLPLRLILVFKMMIMEAIPSYSIPLRLILVFKMMIMEAIPSYSIGVLVFKMMIMEAIPSYSIGVQGKA
ncbi:hypothetical protein POTOM_043011 [Populus tomentosa]|uniref:Uncharacterized protein n=1 Tax=Populus tomentosa TaxID=118781 RepID=A0A8X7YL18_POPTO|nr:hypothetical protein POTOM_043011 [Populus tomentosa]